jgi:hypothetical protein
MLSGADATALSGQLDGVAATVSELQRAQSTAKNDMARQLFLLLIELGGKTAEQASRAGGESLPVSAAGGRLMVATILALGGFGGDRYCGGHRWVLHRRLVAVDYYVEGGQQPGVWFGDGARALGLNGQVERSHFENLLTGRSPDGQRMLTQSKAKQKRFHEAKILDDRAPLDPTARSESKHQRRLHNPGYDLTLSVPKSVSVWWAAGDRQRRSRSTE